MTEERVEEMVVRLKGGDGGDAVHDGSCVRLRQN